MLTTRVSCSASAATTNIPAKPDVESKTWVAMVSGLSVGSESAPLDLKAQLLVEWLMGEDGGVVVSLVLLYPC